MTEDQHQLIHDYLDGRLSRAEFKRLQDLLRDSVEARRCLRNLSTIETKLYDSAASGLPVDSFVVAPDRELRNAITTGLNRSALVSAVAGLLLGVFCTSVVYAVVLPQFSSMPNSLVLLWEEEFETSRLDWQPGFPAKAGQWGGDVIRLVASEFGIVPQAGRRMLRVNPPDAKSFPRIHHVIDLDQHPNLRGGSTRDIQVAASYRVKVPNKRDRYVLRAASFEQKLGDINPRWMNELWSDIGEHSVDHAARGISSDPDFTGWQTVTLSISAPPETRHLVITCFAGVTDGNLQGPIYLDNLQISSLTPSPAP